MRHSLAATVKSLLGEKFMAGVTSIAYGQSGMVMRVKPNQNDIVRVWITIIGEGSFLVDGIKRTRYRKSKLSGMVTAEALEAKVNSIIGEFISMQA